MVTSLPLSNVALWNRISDCRLNNDDANFNLTDRLARDNGWSGEFAADLVEEYRRFAYLASLGECEVTPSDEVDQAWHLHLLYTRHYWGEWTDALGQALHHGPTLGGTAEDQRYGDNYANTLALYTREFGHTPPQQYWPDAGQRFGLAPFFQRINTKTHWVIQKRRMTKMLGSAALLLLAPWCASILVANESAETAGGIQSLGVGTRVLIFIAMMLVMIAVVVLVEYLRRKKSGKNRNTVLGMGCGTSGGGGGGKSKGSEDASSGCGSGCGGGGGGCSGGG